jgi:iron complex outermembrane receptor protein
MRLHLKPGSLDTTSTGAEGESPRNQVSLFASFDVRKSVDLDLWYRYVDSLPNFQLSGYNSIDARVGWKPRTGLELSLVAQNILDHRHAEFRPEILAAQTGEVKRSVYAKMTWNF